MTVYMYRNTCVGVSKIQRKGILLCFSIDLSLKYTLSILLCFHLPTCFIVLFDSLSWNLQHSKKKNRMANVIGGGFCVNYYKQDLLLGLFLIEV